MFLWYSSNTYHINTSTNSYYSWRFHNTVKPRKYWLSTHHIKFLLHGIYTTTCDTGGRASLRPIPRVRSTSWRHRQVVSRAERPILISINSMYYLELQYIWTSATFSTISFTTVYGWQLQRARGGVFGTTITVFFLWVQYARNIVKVFFDKTCARGAQVGYLYVPGTITFSFSKRIVFVPQCVGDWAARRQWWWIYEE